MRTFILPTVLFFLLSRARICGGRKSDHERDHHKHRSHPTDSANGTALPVLAKLSGGVVRGYVSTIAGNDKPVNVFKGVPFAEPPVGNLRFAKPQHKRKWRGEWDATEYSAACPSNTTRTTSPQNDIAEDCLYVNIFAGANCGKKKTCPILYYIHGGGFGFDSAVMFNDTEIITKYASSDIVFVVPAFRLGVFGFLDLGSDKPVPRNLGFHDVIFGLKWAQKELPRFGGDVKRITAMGNSGGAMALMFLFVSPAVPAHYFQQAYISSGNAVFGENVNAVPTRAMLSAHGCLYDPFNGNRTISDDAQLACLRNVSGEDLILSQRELEDDGFQFNGPQTDTELLPGRNYLEMLPHWKPRPTLFSVTADEMHNRGENMTVECVKHLNVFGYESNASLDACLNKYGNITEKDLNLPISRDTMHAETFMDAFVNTHKGADSFMMSFELQNHTGHADDLTFFFGLHPIVDRALTVPERLMDKYFPEMVKRFIWRGRPAKDWVPLSKNGRNYYVLDFQFANDSLVEKPHPVTEYYFPEALKFWLYDLAKVEKFATTSRGRNTSDEWPFADSEEEDSRHGLQRSPPYLRPNWHNVFLAQMPATAPPQTSSAEELPVREIWSAFWLVLSLSVLLTAIILLMVATRFMYRYKNVRGYSYNIDDGFFTEKSRIVTANNGVIRYT